MPLLKTSKAIYAFRLAAVIGAAILLIACTGMPAEPHDYTAFRFSRPRSILVLPPVNISTDIKAPMTFLATSVYPLAESGYYVIPVALSDQTFKQNGITVAEEAHAIDYRRLHEIFGADAALYITILRFGSSYHILSSAVEAEAAARLIDLRNGQQLWFGAVKVVEQNNSSSGDLLSVLVGAAIDQIANMISDRAHIVGRKATYQLLSAEKEAGILYGPYNPKYGTD